MPDVTLGTVAGGSTNLRGYLARPDGNGPWPGVVAIQEAWGLDDVLRRQCDRLAAAGYLTFAPDLFSDGGALRCLVGTFRSLRRGEGKPFRDIEAARQRLLGDDACSGKVGVIGFCMGGAFALLTASQGFDVCSDNYGQLPDDLDDRLRGACPIVASYGAKDKMTAGATEKLTATLDRLGIEHDVKLYPTAGHAFLNDAENGPPLLRPILRVSHVGPEPGAAADAWERIETFFAAHLR